MQPPARRSPARRARAAAHWRRRHVRLKIQAPGTGRPPAPAVRAATGRRQRHFAAADKPAYAALIRAWAAEARGNNVASRVAPCPAGQAMRPTCRNRRGNPHVWCCSRHRGRPRPEGVARSSDHHPWPSCSCWSSPEAARPLLMKKGGRRSRSRPSEARQEEDPSVFQPLDPFTVNLADPGREHYLQIGLTCEVATGDVGDAAQAADAADPQPGAAAPDQQSRRMNWPRRRARPSWPATSWPWHARAGQLAGTGRAERRARHRRRAFLLLHHPVTGGRITGHVQRSSVPGRGRRPPQRVSTARTRKTSRRRPATARSPTTWPNRSASSGAHADPGDHQRAPGAPAAGWAVQLHAQSRRSRSGR